MNDALLVCGFQRFCDLSGDRKCFIDRQRSACDPIRECFAFDQFHNQRASAVCLFETVNSCDVRMVQRSEDFGFALESSEAFRVCRERLRQDLESDIALQSRVSRPVDLPHAARTDGSGDFVGAEAGPASKAHFFSNAVQGRTTGKMPTVITFRALKALIAS